MNQNRQAATTSRQERADVYLDTSQIPDHVRDALAAATLDLIRGILSQPGGREALDAERRKYERETVCKEP